MTKQIFTPFGDLVNAFELRSAYAGIIEPGVYRGYDTLQLISETSEEFSISISHQQTGFIKTLENNQLDTDPYGVLFMRSGMVIHDNEIWNITLPKPNQPQINALVATLEFVEDLDSPGAYINLSIVSDVTFSYVPDNIAKQIVIGFLTFGYKANDDNLFDPDNHPMVDPALFDPALFRMMSPSLANQTIIHDLSNFALLRDPNFFNDVNTFQYSTFFNGLILKKMSHNATISGDNYIVINTDGVEHIVDLSSNPNPTNFIKGFKHNNKPYGGMGITVGTTINVRFTNVTPASWFFAPVSNGKGFHIPEQIEIIPNLLYTIRLESFSNQAEASFSISPQLGWQTFMDFKNYIESVLEDNLSHSFAQVLVNNEDGQIYYSYQKDPATESFLVNISANVKAVKTVNASELLPNHLRPLHNLFQTDEENGNGIKVLSSGQVQATNLVGFNRTFGISFLAKLI